MNSNTHLLSEPTVETKPSESAGPSADLSLEIAQKVDRHPGDRVRVMRVWGDHYRCNWIAPKNRLDVLETFIVRKSEFLHVTKSADGSLNISTIRGEN